MLGGGGNGAGGRGAEGRGHGNLEVSRVGGHRRARRDAPPHRWLDTTPSRRAIGTTYDRAQIRTNPTPGSSERMSGFRDPRREPQDRPPRGVAILPREIAKTTRKCQNRLPMGLA